MPPKKEIFVFVKDDDMWSQYFNENNKKLSGIF